MKVLYVNGQNAKYFDSENKKKPVFAKYFSPTCPACVAMETDWDDMCKDIDSNYNTDLMMAQIDPEGMNGLENMNTYSDVQYVPALILLKNGKKVDEYNGPKKKEDLIKFLMKSGFIKQKHVGGRRIKKRSYNKTRSNNGNMGKKGRKTRKRKTKRKIRRRTNRK
jgi:thioredoxin-like negative regulator of GroEL|tara:strand:- start:2456 stop:2950 length:495 start_codon:yes stop_codon:yes gene_type:complete